MASPAPGGVPRGKKREILQERTWQRTVEEIVDFLVPRIQEQIVDVPVPHITKKNGDLVKFSSPHIRAHRGSDRALFRPHRGEDCGTARPSDPGTGTEC